MLVLLPAIQPAAGPGTPALPALPDIPTVQEELSVAAGNTTAIDRLTTKEEVVAFIRSHTGQPQYAASYDNAPVTLLGETSQAIERAAPAATSAPVVTAAPTIGSVVHTSGWTASAAQISPGTPTDRQYSTTNVQVKDVDEADIIKTDGENIYVVAGRCMHILRAYPAKDAEILSTQRFGGNPVALYAGNGRVVLIATEYYNRPITTCPPGKCYYSSTSTPRTLVYVFSVKDPANPQLVRELTIDGTYASSRMIGTQLYFVTGTPVPYDLGFLELPEVHDNLGGITTPAIYGFNTTDKSFAFSTIGSLDTAGSSGVQAKSFLIGSAGTVYVSPTILYVAVPDRGYNRWSPTITIHAFAIDNGKISWKAGGKVDGTLLNQYSLDEYDGNLRVATTVSTGSWQMNSGSYSQITVLDKNLDVVGILPDIAPGERIYAARFMGDRLYLVTFRQTDPFFVIGLANPRQPEILGELKLPGFSNYLHPYDTDHIIAIGKESQSGPVKMALFDVSDVNNPALIDSESLGGSYSNSPVLTDPKAFLFDKGKDLLVLPVHLMQGEYRCTPKGPCTQPTIWGGAYVYGVNPKTGFFLKGTVTHYENYYGSQGPVKRSLYIGDTLYTMSDAKIVMSDLARSLDRLNEVDFQ